MVYDNRIELTGFDFQKIMRSFDIQPQSTKAKYGRMHLAIGDMLDSTVFEREDWFEEVSYNFQPWVITIKTSTTVGYAPEHVVFDREMIFRQNIVDWN